MKLNISDDLNLPIAAVTEKMAFLGRTGSGKTYAAQKLAEEMHAAGAQFVVLDPVGVWFGLRLASDGKRAGLAVPVLGGLHGDIPLESTGGALIANLIVDRGTSVVLDVSQFESDAQKARFAHDFADRFFFRKKSAPSAVHLFIEECQEFVPQNPQRDEALMLHAFTRLMKIGRNFGIGGSLISQRPQEVNKKVLNLAEVLFAFQLTGPQERKAVDGWIADKGIDEDIAAVLPKLEVGHPHVWSPAWLKISRVVPIAKKMTFDASSTPIVGRAAATRELSPIDLEELRKEMAATIEKAKAEDPRELRKEIADLKWENDDLRRKLATRPAEMKRVEVPVLKDTQIERLVKQHERAIASSNEVLQAIQRVNGRHDVLIHGAIKCQSPVVARTLIHGPGDPDVGHGGLRRILIALAQRPQGLTVRQIGVRAGLSSQSGTFSTYMSRARQSGWVAESGPGQPLRITEQGLKALGSYDPLPSGQDLLGYWLRELGGSGAARMLQALAEAYPKALTTEELGNRADISHQSGTFSTYLSRLRTLELVEGRGQLRASGELFG